MTEDAFRRLNAGFNLAGRTLAERYILRSGSRMLVCGSPETLLAYLRANPEAWYAATVEAA